MQQVEISLVLGFIFDLAIPPLIVHPTFSEKHAQHLEHYWPLFIFGTMIEFVAFLLVHPDLFTLVVCLKTTALLGIWLGRDDKGGFVGSLFIIDLSRKLLKISVRYPLSAVTPERRGKLNPKAVVLLENQVREEKNEKTRRTQR